MKTIIKHNENYGGDYIKFSINKLFYLYKDKENHDYYINPKKYKRITPLIVHKFKVKVVIFLYSKRKVRRAYCIQYGLALDELKDEVIYIGSIYPADLHSLLKDKHDNYTYKYLKQYFSNVIDKKSTKIYIHKQNEEYLDNLVRHTRLGHILKEINDGLPNVFPGEEE